MKKVGQYKNRMEAEIAKGFLENANIKAFISADDEGGLHPALGAQKGAQLFVPDAMEEQAKNILTQVNDSKPLKEGE